MSEPLQAMSGDMIMTLGGDALTVQLYNKTTVYPLDQIYSVEYMPPTWIAGGQFTFVRSVGSTTMGLASGNRKKMTEVWGAFSEALTAAVERAVPKVETPATVNERKPIFLYDAHYLGGIDGVPADTKGMLVINKKQIGIAVGYDTEPSLALLPLASIAFIEVDGGQVAKNRALPVVLFGVAGLAAKGTKDRTFINATLTSGSVVVYQVDNLPPQQVVAQISSFLREAGVELGAPAQSTTAVHSVADEIEKLAALRDRGILTDEEFSTKKAQLLA
jgi:hypothetical protein